MPQQTGESLLLRFKNYTLCRVQVAMHASRSGLLGQAGRHTKGQTGTNSSLFQLMTSGNPCPTKRNMLAPPCPPIES